MRCEGSWQTAVREFLNEIIRELLHDLSVRAKVERSTKTQRWWTKMSTSVTALVKSAFNQAQQADLIIFYFSTFPLRKSRRSRISFYAPESTSEANLSPQLIQLLLIHLAIFFRVADVQWN